MVIPRRKKYRPWNPEAYAHQAFSPADRLPESDLVYFLLDTIPQFNLDTIYASYVGTRGLAAMGYQQILYLLPVSLFGMAISASESLAACVNQFIEPKSRSKTYKSSESHRRDNR